MNKHLENIKKLLQDTNLAESEKQLLQKAVADADKQWAITDFKLDRTEKVKKTTAILLEETIEELEQKRKAVEAQNRELEIETSLERVRTVAMGMKTPGDLLNICEVLFKELDTLGFTELRNAMINIYNDENQTIKNYDYADKVGKTVTKVPYNFHPLVEKQVMVTKSAADAFFEFSFTGEELKSFRELRKNNGEQDDPQLELTDALHYYFYSIGDGSIGISTYSSINEKKLDILKRFRNVFDLAYKRYVDITTAAAQAREAQIETGLERVRSRSLAMHNTSELQQVIHAVHKELLSLNIAINGGSFIAINSDIQTQLRCWGSGGTADTSEEVQIPLYEKPFCSNLINGIKKGPGFFTEEFTQEEKKDFFSFLFQHEPWSKLDAKQQVETLSSPGGYTRSCYVSPHSTIFIINHLGEKFSAADNDILRRFGKVFEQTYTRFLDLQKAEAQAKEAQIETALERVRARTMGMQKSEELKDVIQVVYDQFVYLNVNTEHTGFVMDYKLRDDRLIWVASKRGVPSQLTIPYFDCEYYNSFNEAKEKGHDFFATNLSFEDKNSFYSELFKYIPELSADARKFYFNCPGLAISTVLLENVGLYMENFLGTSFTDEENAILMRFGKVFQQTYTRFIDLQKAEAQSREAQIQLALERGRTQSMIMQHSNELDDTLRVFHEQVLLLGINSAFSFLWLPDEEKNNHIFWAAWAEDNKGSTVFKSKAITYPLNRNEPATAQCLIDWKSGDPVFSYAVPPEGVPAYFAAWQELIAGVEKLTPQHFTNGLYYVEAFMKYGCFGVILATDLNADEKKILDRFATEFERAYTRFLDLQKAEAQAKEANIEAALERVRARTMAMQHSDELAEASFLLDSQVRALGIKTWGCAFNIYGDNESTEWFSNEMGTMPAYKIPREKLFLRYYEAGQTGKSIHIETFTGEACVDHYNYLCSLPVLGEALKQVKASGGSFPVQQTDHVIYFKYGYLLFITLEAALEAHDIFIRFGKVFEQTYTRFLDLQKAEAQAREAQVEAALERVRSVAMSMMKSADLGTAVAVVFEELDKLNLGTLRCGIAILSKEKRSANVWTTSTTNEGTVVHLSGDESIDIHPLLQNQFDAWLKKEDFAYTLEGDGLNDYYKAVSKTNLNLPEQQKSLSKNTLPKQFYFSSPFTAGGVFTFRDTPFPEEAKAVLKRFANVFDLTYQRFLDLQKAEAQAKEAQIETALERVRSRTLAMQKSDELAETASEVFKQLMVLGIEPNRLYIGIVNADTKEMEMWATDEDGTRVGKKFSFFADDNDSVKKLYEGWLHKKKSVTVDMQGVELDSYIAYLQQLQIPLTHALTQKKRVQSVAYFDKGFIGMASPDDQSLESIQLLERFAAVFNLTFTRFNDLKVAEAHAEQAVLDLIKLQTEKKRAEDALTELRSTQTQLIQSEKMASLGELTAGIAHEIQNPLNFVNNFSEVSKELLDEMREAIEKGDTEEAKEIMNDVIQNLEKINHHGKRADGIVKGMLQHSRSSSATKELTDINKLADEYLRLAYHGLRAKDKSFNATLNTAYDETLEKINIIPQDIGRVVLNLITNAFYAIAEKKTFPQAQGDKSYEPTVSVSTKKINDKVEIKVADNGNGIPKNIIDKIFQPFFTTKPTGQGTGLGLSLAYDIVKAHAGELKVETKEGEGSSFIIQIPYSVQ